MIVIPDTNVWISALQFAKQYGTPTQALEKAISQDVIATCSEIEDEIHRVLTESSPGNPIVCNSPSAQFSSAPCEFNCAEQ